MKKRIIPVCAIALASAFMFSSCIGNFALTRKVLDWNQQVGNKFVNELVFVVFLPVYSVAMLADGLVLNSIEFWSGTNPVADAGTVKKIETKDGTYAIETKQDGYHIQKEGEKDALDLVYNEADQSWSMVADGDTTRMFKYIDGDEVVMYLPDGREMNVELTQGGVLAFKQAIQDASFYAAR